MDQCPSMKRLSRVKRHVSVVVQATMRNEALGRSRAAFYSRFLVSRAHRASCHLQWWAAQSLRRLSGSHKIERAHPPARGFAPPRRWVTPSLISSDQRTRHHATAQTGCDCADARGRRHMRPDAVNLLDFRVAQRGEASPETQGSPPRARRAAASRREAIGPGPQGPTVAMPPTHPRRLNEQSAQLARTGLREWGRDAGAPRRCLRAAPGRWPP